MDYHTMTIWQLEQEKEKIEAELWRRDGPQESNSECNVPEGYTYGECYSPKEKNSEAPTPRTDALVTSMQNAADATVGTLRLLELATSHSTILANHARQLEQELAIMTSRANALFARLQPVVAYIEGIPVGYGEDEVDRLHRQLEAAQSASGALRQLDDALGMYPVTYQEYKRARTIIDAALASTAKREGE